MKVAIVILNWNGKEMLKEYLPSVIQHTSDKDVEIVVADNGSSDGSVEMMKREFPEIRLIVFDENHGFAEGYNKALSMVDSQYYVLLNSDVEIRHDKWLKPLVDYLDLHPDVAACQPKLLSLRQPKYFEYAGAAGGFIDKYGYPFCRGRIFGKIEIDNGQYDNATDVFWATGAALVIRKELFWQVGGFDSRFFAHMEEIDLCWRLHAAGKRVVCVPDSSVYHLGGGSLGQGHPHKTFLNFRNNLMMLYKNLPESQFKKVMKRRKWLDALAAFSFILKFDFKNFKAVRKARKAFKHMIPELTSIREEVQKQIVDDVLHCVLPKSLVWEYFFHRHTSFFMLPELSK